MQRTGISKEDFIKIAKELPYTSFKNEYGERFNIHSTGTSILMSGDEVNMMVKDKDKTEGYIPLFNPSFSIWSSEELFKLGQALMELHKPKDDKR